MTNAAIYAMKILQDGMVGEAEKNNLTTEEAINELIYEVRKEVEGLSEDL